MTAGLASRPPPKRPYGDEYAEAFGAERGASIVTRSLPLAEMGVTEVKVVRPTWEKTSPVPHQDGYLISYHVEELRGMAYWERGRGIGPFDHPAGYATIHDFRREPVVLVDRPLHTVQWFVPRAALMALADEANADYVDELRHEPGVSMRDDVVAHLNLALLPVLRTGEPVSRIFTDHLAMAFATHMACAYGDMQLGARRFKGGLAPWQERRAKEMIRADLLGETSLAEIAAACGLSLDHFARAFRRSTGLPPHAWLNRARIDLALMLLRKRERSLSEIALACGFVDQSHFTRVFVRRMAITPGAWRRMLSN